MLTPKLAEVLAKMPPADSKFPEPFHPPTTLTFEGVVAEISERWGPPCTCENPNVWGTPEAVWQGPPWDKWRKSCVRLTFVANGPVTLTSHTDAESVRLREWAPRWTLAPNRWDRDARIHTVAEAMAAIEADHAKTGTPWPIPLPPVNPNDYGRR